MKSHGFFSAQSHLLDRSEGMSARGSDVADIRLVLSGGGRGWGEVQGDVLHFTLSWDFTSDLM